MKDPTELLPEANPTPLASDRAATEAMECARLGSQPLHCGARTGNGGLCRKPPLAGGNRCRLHGGATPRGEESRHYKHGLYQRHLPKTLRKDYERLMTDPQFMEARAEPAILQIRLTNWPSGSTPA